MICTAILFRVFFGRNELKPDDISLCYEDIDQEKYPRFAINFLSNGNSLRGYLYGGTNDAGLIIYAHGVLNGADGFLAETMYFVDNGWRVLAFDGTGSRESEGKRVGGLPQTKIDVEAALVYVSQDIELSKLPVVLFGHSMGGYAVAAALKEYASEVSAAVCVATFNSPIETMYYQSKVSAGFLADILYPFVWLYQEMSFGKDANISAVDGINETDTPVLMVYSETDAIIPYDKIGLFAYKDRLSNSNAVFQCFDTDFDGHTTMLLSEESAKYSTEQWSALEKLRDEYHSAIPDDVFSEFYSQINKEKMYVLNLQRMDYINDFLINAVRGNT